MIRVVLAVCMALTAALTGANIANADPWPPSPCGFVLSAPEVVQVDGVSKVTATVSTGECGAAASPYQSVACLSLQGADGTSCMQGTDTAQVFLEPYKPGATYVSSGRGCGIIVPTLPAQNCQLLGPTSATL